MADRAPLIAIAAAARASRWPKGELAYPSSGPDIESAGYIHDTSPRRGVDGHPRGLRRRLRGLDLERRRVPLRISGAVVMPSVLTNAGVYSALVRAHEAGHTAAMIELNRDTVPVAQRIAVEEGGARSRYADRSG